MHGIKPVVDSSNRLPIYTTYNPYGMLGCLGGRSFVSSAGEKQPQMHQAEDVAAALFMVGRHSRNHAFSLRMPIFPHTDCDGMRESKSFLVPYGHDRIDFCLSR